MTNLKKLIKYGVCKSSSLNVIVELKKRMNEARPFMGEGNTGK